MVNSRWKGKKKLEGEVKKEITSLESKYESESNYCFACSSHITVSQDLKNITKKMKALFNFYENCI